MADRRMFTKRITDGDVFTSLPPTTQCLYFHLCMGADDDGFSNNIRIALFNAHASMDDFNMLVSKRFIIPFESGVIVIKHWRLHNYIQTDRYHETKFLEEKSRITLKKNGVYTECIQNGYEMDTSCIQNGYRLDTEVRLDKDSIEKVNNIDAPQEESPKDKKHKYGDFKHVLLTDDEYLKLGNDYGSDTRDKAITFLDAYIEEKGYKSKSHYLAIKRWVVDAVTKPGKKTKSGFNEIMKTDYDMEAIEKQLLGE